MGPERLVVCVLGLHQYPSAFPLGLDQYPRRSSDRPDYLTQRFSDQLRLRLYRVKPVTAPHRSCAPTLVANRCTRRCIYNPLGVINRGSVEKKKEEKRGKELRMSLCQRRHDLVEDVLQDVEDQKTTLFLENQT